MAGETHYLGIFKGHNAGVALHPADQIGEEGLHLPALQGIVHTARHAPQVSVFFHEISLESGVGNG